MPLKILDRSGYPGDFVHELRKETRGDQMVVRGEGWIQAARQFPDIALILGADEMSTPDRGSLRISHSVDLERVQERMGRGEPLMPQMLQEELVAATEGLETLGLAFRLGSDFWESEILRSIPGAMPGMRVVAYCPALIETKADQIRDEAKWLRPGKCVRALQRFVIHHELGHFFIDPRLELDDARFHEAFASYLAIGALGDPELRDVVESFSTLHQPFRYNYYLLLRNYEGTKQILPQLLSGDLSGARDAFYRELAEQPLIETNNRTLVVKGDLRGWPGFGAANASIACAGEITGIANLRSGTVVASRIKIIDGLLAAATRVYTNDVESISRLASHSPNVKVVPTARANLSSLIRADVPFAEVVAICEGQNVAPSTARRAAPIGPYNVCIPCRCGVFVITDERTRDPDAVDSDLERSAICDHCGFEAKHVGKGIVCLTMDEARRLHWALTEGNPETQKLIKETEKWLERETPATVIARIARSGFGA